MLDNYDLFLRHEDERENMLNRLPTCEDCGEKIQEDFLYEINGALICEGCLNTHYRKCTDNYMQ